LVSSSFFNEVLNNIDFSRFLNPRIFKEYI